MDEKGNCVYCGYTYQAKLLESFFKDRIHFINENKFPVVLTADPPPRFLMYLIPEKYLEINFDIKNLEDPSNHLVPFGEAPETVLCDFNFDGIIFFSSFHEKHAYTQCFRDGRVETVAAIGQKGIDMTHHLISLVQLQKNLLLSLANHLSVLRRFSLSEPYYLYFRLLFIENVRLDPQDIITCGIDAKGRNKTLVRNDLLFPRYKLEHADADLKECLTPFFDILWNIFGFSSAPKDCV